MTRPKVPSMSRETRRESAALIDVMNAPMATFVESLQKGQPQQEIAMLRIPLSVACREYLRKTRLNSTHEDIDFIQKFLEGMLRKKKIPSETAKEEAIMILKLTLAYYIEQNQKLSSGQAAVEDESHIPQDIRDKTREEIREASEEKV